jgi:hypothetical protein
MAHADALWQNALPWRRSMKSMRIAVGPNGLAAAFTNV